jgi:hypothetical protein
MTHSPAFDKYAFAMRAAQHHDTKAIALVRECSRSANKASSLSAVN